jgi:cell division protein ZapB
MEEQLQLTALEQKIDELIRRCELLSSENLALRNRVSTWSVERSRLVEKNEIARAKIESMISRLRSLEQGS